jgi:hypothetical protein
MHKTFPRNKDHPAGYQMVIRHILHYVIAHPDAKDTLRGILRWWLPWSIEPWAEAVVQEALDVLVAKGWMTRRQTPSSQQLYGVNRERLEEMKAFLQARDSARNRLEPGL